MHEHILDARTKLCIFQDMIEQILGKSYIKKKFCVCVDYSKPGGRSGLESDSDESVSSAFCAAVEVCVWVAVLVAGSADVLRFLMYV